MKYIKYTQNRSKNCGIEKTAGHIYILHSHLQLHASEQTNKFQLFSIWNAFVCWMATHQEHRHKEQYKKKTVNKLLLLIIHTTSNEKCDMKTNRLECWMIFPLFASNAHKNIHMYLFFNHTSSFCLPVLVCINFRICRTFQIRIEQSFLFRFICSCKWVLFATCFIWNEHQYVRIGKSIFSLHHISFEFNCSSNRNRTRDREKTYTENVQFCAICEHEICVGVCIWIFFLTKKLFLFLVKVWNVLFSIFNGIHDNSNCVNLKCR